MFEVKNPKFIKTVVDFKEVPTLYREDGRAMQEVAFVGRSNAGKSTLINFLFRHSKIAKTSKTPGKTQAINLFTLNDEVLFIDLPGYGFAKVPKSVKRDWGPLVQGYLETSPQLQVILFAFDIRRDPKEEDLQLMHWITENEKKVILVLTKADKLKKREIPEREEAIVSGFQPFEVETVVVSAKAGKGRDTLLKKVQAHLT